MTKPKTLFFFLDTFSKYCYTSELNISSFNSQIVDDNGNTLGVDDVGEIAVNTPFLMKQYLNNPEVFIV